MNKDDWDAMWDEPGTTGDEHDALPSCLGVVAIFLLVWGIIGAVVWLLLQ